MVEHKALVILGNTGIGKDPLANLFAEKFARVKNIKFSELTKRILAQLFRVPREYMEDKDWRNSFTVVLGNRDTGVSPMILLNSLYFGAQQGGLHQKNLKWAAEEIGNSFPVFTDVRRLAEFDSIRSLNPLVIRLQDPNFPPGETDAEQNKLYDLLNEAEVVKRTIQTFSVDFKDLVKQLARELKLDTREKGTLNVYVGQFSLNHRLPEPPLPAIDRFEPLSGLVQRLENLLTFFGVNKRMIPVIVGQLASEIDPESLAVEEFTGVKALVFRDYHEPFIKTLRKVFNLKVFILDESVRQYAQVIFKTGELA